MFILKNVKGHYHKNIFFLWQHSITNVEAFTLYIWVICGGEKFEGSILTMEWKKSIYYNTFKSLYKSLVDIDSN